MAPIFLTLKPNAAPVSFSGEGGLVLQNAAIQLEAMQEALKNGNKSGKSGEQHQGLNQMPEQFAGNTSLRESALAPAPEWNTPRE